MSITFEDFREGCAEISRHWQASRCGTKWSKVEVKTNYGTQYLRLVKSLSANVNDTSSPEFEAAQDNGMEEPDEEALIRSRSGHAGILVQYDIVHSPSYQVPVLYVQINDTGSQAVRLPSVDEAYEMLVPQSRRAQIKAVGVMGGLSMTDHPMTGLPVYFVHPCRTAEAMDGMVNDTKVKPVEFLLLWLGLIGASVGLEVPVDVAQAVATETEALPSHQ